MKNYKLKFSLLFFTFITLGISAQVGWPFDDEDVQATVVGTVGEGRAGGTRFHRGVDLTNGEDTSVYAINSGAVTWVPNGGNSYIRIGNVFYIHCEPIASILNAGQGGLEVEAGDYIGEMLPIQRVHVHLQSNVNYLNQELNPYVDNHDPELITTRLTDGYRLYKNGLTRTSNTNQQNNLHLNTSVTVDGQDFTVIYSKIDIVADVEDRRVTPTGGNGGYRTAPFTFEYQVQDFDNPNVGNPLYEFELSFDNLPNHDASDFVFHPQTQGDGEVSTHIITSHYRTTPYDRYLNTIIAQDETEDWENNNNHNANHISEALFPDDKYRLYIDAFDVDYNDSPNNSLANRIEANVVVDNFLPYIKRVNAFRLFNPSVNLYDASWAYNNNILQFNITQNSPLPSNELFEVNVTPSEPLKELTLTIDGASYSMTKLSNSEVWYVLINASSLGVGTKSLIFEGEDYAGNDLLINPESLPVKMANGNWPNGTLVGADNRHNINIVTGGPLPFGANFNNGCSGNRSNNCLQVCFNDTSEPSGDITSWFWEFGDNLNSTSTLQNPSFTYASPGTYDVTLTVTNSSNDTSVITQTITVDDCSSDITALISSDVNSGVIPLRVVFQDLSTGDIYNRAWKILDSSGIDITNSITFINGDQYSESMEVYFSQPDNYSVTLDIEDFYGNTVTSNQININAVSQSNTDLFVDFNWESPYSAGTITQFNSQVTGDCGNYSYFWKFNDTNGTTNSFFPNPNHTFPVPGNYSVELCVTDSCGNSKCITKYINVSESGSGLVADMHSPAENLDWIVYKGDPVSFYDHSSYTSTGNIASHSWFFDFQPGVSSQPDIYNSYPINVNVPVTHTYNEVGTYRVRLYVGDSNYQFESFQERLITVVDETDYLEIPVISNTKRQVINNRALRDIQTRDFDGMMLTQTRYYAGVDAPIHIEAYAKDSQGNYSKSATLRQIPIDQYGGAGGPMTYAKAIGYMDKVALVINMADQPIPYFKIELYQKNNQNWSSNNLIQTITYPRQGDPSGSYSAGTIDLKGNTLAIKYFFTPTGSSEDKFKIDVYELNSGGNSYIQKAALYNSSAISDEGNLGILGSMKLSHDALISSSYTGIPGTSSYNSNIAVYNKNQEGWSNSIEDARLSGSFTQSVYGWDQSISNNYVTAINSNTPSYERRVHVWERGIEGWSSSQEKALLKSYIDNYDDLVAVFARSTSTTDNMVSIFNDYLVYPNSSSSSQENSSSNDNRFYLLPRRPLLSSDGKFIISQGSRVRDFPNNDILHLFTKTGSSWESKEMENARMYPSYTTSVETNEYTPFDEDDGEITQIFTNKNNGMTSYIYTYDVNIAGVDVCSLSIQIVNQTINTSLPSQEGGDITISNTTFNNQASITYSATNRIVIKPNTIIKSGATVRARIVSCDQIN